MKWYWKTPSTRPDKKKAVKKDGVIIFADKNCKTIRGGGVFLAELRSRKDYSGRLVISLEEQRGEERVGLATVLSLRV